jgi:hypothetical protein
LRLLHRLVRPLAVPLLAVVPAACGSAPPPAPSAPASDPSPSSPAAQAVQKSAGKSTPTDDAPEPAPSGDSGGLPTACANPSAAFCTPPSDFVDRLCAKPHQGAALALLAHDTPFTRLYVRGRVDELIADEEVIVLRFHAPQKGGMIVGSNSGSYDLLRWDGTCSMAMEAEVVTRTAPPHATTAHVQWHHISAHVQDVLIASSDAVKKAHAKRGKECKGAMTGDVSAACEKADRALVAAIVDYVRSGGKLPPPDDVP